MEKVSLTPRRIEFQGLRPEDVAARLAHLDGFVFLDSASAAPDIPSVPGLSLSQGAMSIIAAHPRRVIRGHISDVAKLRGALRSEQTHPEADWGFPLGGAFGFIAFDGSFTFGIYDNLLLYRHAEETWYAVGTLLTESFAAPVPAAPFAEAPLHFTFPVRREQFCGMVERAQEYIAAGDIYQVNLSHRVSAPWSSGHDAFLLYQRLRESSPAPFAAFLNFDGKRILSSSPELFLRMSGNLAQTRPIKGTRPRFSDPGRDERSAYDLITSPKEVAELVMITDLERNDLGKTCRFGSVHVIELLKLERFAQVFHLVSTIEGTLRPGVDHLAALQACFPGGSISGAPKKRALEIIHELEPHSRGLYTGAIGYVGFNGESQFNIAIRTAVAERDTLHFQVGAGIVADSVPAMEYEETLHKAAGLLRASEEYNSLCTRRDSV